MIPSRRIAALLTLASLAAPPLPAQVLVLRVRDDSSRAPVLGAIVRLLAASGPVDQGLSDAGGRILLRAPAPGTYRIQADRIGYGGLLTGPIALAAGDTLQQELMMPSARVLLPTIVAEGESNCDVEQQGGTPAAALWSDIRKALTANLLTERRGTVRVRTTLFERDVTRAGTVGPERGLGSRMVTGRPFVTLAPADLAARGFVYRDRDSLTYNGPDAALLLSDEFVATHCFRAVPGSDGLVGLAFEPIARRQLADVRGALWLDRQTSELRYLEFHYTGLEGAAARSTAGGRIDFERLPNGAWIVSDWHVRMPLIVAREVPTGPGFVTREERVIGYRDRGGRARVASDSTASRPGLALATVSGTVFDNLAAAPLAGAIARVMGERDSAITDSTGAFRLRIPVVGPRVVTVRHPRLGLVPDGSTTAVTLSGGEEVRVEMSVPSIEAFVRTFCGRERGTAGLLGQAWGQSGQPVEGLAVRATWQAKGREGVGEASTRSGSRGIYALCRLPPGRRVTVRVGDAAMLIAEGSLTLEPGEFRWLDLRGPSPRR